MGGFGARVLRKYVKKVKELKTNLRDKASQASVLEHRVQQVGEREKQAVARSNHIKESIARIIKTVEESQPSQYSGPWIFDWIIEQLGNIN